VGRLNGRVAIVTGGAGGIGSATAELFIEAGARVVVADLDAEAARAVAERLSPGEREAVAVAADVSTEEGAASVVGAALERWGRLDVLFNNAAAMEASFRDYGVVDTDLAVWDETFAVNVRGAMLCCRHAVPAMLAGDGGAIINTASIGGILPTDNLRVAYSTSKAALIMLTRHVAASYGKRGIRCNAVAPGIVLTRRARQHLGEAAIAANLAGYPSPRLAEPRDVAEVVVFLAGPGAAMVNGSVIAVDGGVLAHRAYVEDPERTAGGD